MSWVEKNRKINNRGGEGDYWGLDSNFLCQGCKFATYLRNRCTCEWLLLRCKKAGK